MTDKLSDRDLLFAHHLGFSYQMSHEEIAQELGVSRHTITRDERVALAKLRLIFEKRGIPVEALLR